MREIVFYALAAAASLLVLGYTVHMFIGGLVSPATERIAIAVVCVIGAAVIGAMAWDVVRRRRSGARRGGER